jgi:hypothetical protein
MAATSVARVLPVQMAAPVTVIGRGVMRRRRISPDTGHALEILGHAVEYLTDEFIRAGGSVSPYDGQVQAVQMLMRLNRDIYLDCPEVPTFAHRVRALLHLHPAQTPNS